MWREQSESRQSQHTRLFEARPSYAAHFDAGFRILDFLDFARRCLCTLMKNSPLLLGGAAVHRCDIRGTFNIGFSRSGQTAKRRTVFQQSVPALAKLQSKTPRRAAMAEHLPQDTRQHRSRPPRRQPAQQRIRRKQRIRTRHGIAAQQNPPGVAATMRCRKRRPSCNASTISPCRTSATEQLVISTISPGQSVAACSPHRRADAQMNPHPQRRSQMKYRYRAKHPRLKLRVPRSQSCLVHR